MDRFIDGPLQLEQGLIKVLARMGHVDVHHSPVRTRPQRSVTLGQVVVSADSMTSSHSGQISFMVSV